MSKDSALPGIASVVEGEIRVGIDETNCLVVFEVPGEAVCGIDAEAAIRLAIRLMAAAAVVGERTQGKVPN